MIPLKDVNPTERLPIFTISIIIICTLVFLREVSMSPLQLEQFVKDYGLVPSVLFNENISLLYRISRIFTAMFLHGSFAHLIGNMLYLWIFGNNIEDKLGHIRFLIFYLLCGIVAGLAQASLFPDSSTPMIGASGAIAGMLGGYLVLFPGARIITLVIIFYYITIQEIPAFIVIGIWFLLQFMSSLGSLAGIQTGIAYIAHVGGFLAGLIFIMIFPKKKRYYRYLPRDYDF